MVSRYAKIFLVPFGEFVPWPFSLFIDRITLEAGDFVPGNEVAVAPVGKHGVGTFICYESVFARGVRRFVANGAEVLVNISNEMGNITNSYPPEVQRGVLCYKDPGIPGNRLHNAVSFGTISNLVICCGIRWKIDEVE